MRSLAATKVGCRGKATTALLLPGGEGFILTARVRLMHAGVRRLLHASGRWDQTAWSTPINQHDMVATILLFSSVWLDGCRALGVDFTSEEARDHMHLWRYVGVLMGVEESLLPLGEADAQELQAFIRLTQYPPDEDSRRLAHALIQPPPTSTPTVARRWAGPLWQSYLSGICHVLLDEALCAGLGIAPSPTTPWIRRASALRRTTNKLAHASPALERLAATWGERYWQESVGHVAGTLSHDYATPTRLADSR